MSPVALRCLLGVHLWRYRPRVSYQAGGRVVTEWGPAVGDHQCRRCGVIR